MCGIAGATIGEKNGIVAQMLCRLMHRGPDGHGLWSDQHHALGHSRLSIIDLKGGAQPMEDCNGKRHVVFNGEIYNYRTLRERLGRERFKTESDTESILVLADTTKDSQDWVRELDGMFAFALVGDGDLALARDPLGIKPLYIGHRDGQMFFASEIKALLGLCSEITEFPAGHVFTKRSGMKQYFHLKGDTPVENADDAANGIRERLENAVVKRLMADVPVGVFLSGGLDSSLIAALAARHKHPLDTFSVGTAGSPDRVHAREVSKLLKTRHRERIYTIKEARAALEEVIYFLESFDCALVRSAIPNFFLAKLASEHVKVALAGEGADELFAGYEYLKSIALDDLDAELRQITDALHNTNLQRCDRMSMAHGLEVRVPFLDVAMLAYAFGIPACLKQYGPQRIEKWILRKAAGSLLPDKIVWRKKVKFAAGSGIGEQMARIAEREIPDAAFAREREISKGVFLRSKEELMYYRIFNETFGAEALVPLVGRSRSV